MPSEASTTAIFPSLSRSISLPDLPLERRCVAIAWGRAAEVIPAFLFVGYSV